MPVAIRSPAPRLAFRHVTVIGMFPLGTVLLPGEFLPLHVFEPRYRTLVHDCLKGSPEFGVVLIERGSEVGGGDTRSDVGTIARLVEAVELPDGRFALTCGGTRRVRVRQWLADDPYPRADVDDWRDEAVDMLDPDDLITTERALRRVLALSAEAGDAVARVATEISDDPVLATYHLCALAPLGPADRYRLLTRAGPAERVALLAALLAEAEEVLVLRLEGGTATSGPA
ncbi:MAG: ATP-dependent Lon protease [Acidimicrobiaceae bacterium]|nr:ATP-dependent Lon protease [Acidimicrobiaceae bacterium]